MRWFELVPFLSNLVQSGRCRHCAARIDPRHLFGESAGGLACLAAALGVLAGGWSVAAASALALLALLLLPLVLTDMARLWLPDPLVALLGAAGLLAGGSLGIALADRAAGALGGWLALALVARGWRAATGRDGMGGGDPKLFGALGAWLGWQALPLLLLGAALTGLGWVAARRAARGRMPRLVPLGAMMAPPALLLATVAALR